MEYYSAIKKNKITPFTAIWLDLEIVILSEVTQGEKDKYQAYPHDGSRGLKRPAPASPPVTDNHHGAGAKGALTISVITRNQGRNEGPCHGLGLLWRGERDWAVKARCG